MRVPIEWLKQYVNVNATAEEVATKLTMGGLEVEGIESPEDVYLRLEKDGVSDEVANEAAGLAPVLDVYVTPNRGDCNSIIGVAREVAALYGLPLLLPDVPASENGGETAKQTSVVIENPDLCPRYAAKIMRGVKVEPAPLWLQARIAAAGQRPINNVVDVTNYVLLELGQPLHAFDLDNLGENRIVARTARPGETLKTIDEAERPLDESMLIIADATKPVAVAGVMGGFDSEVSETTTNLLIESAHFNPLSIRRAARALGMRTEASYRFERVVDPNGVRRAADRACQLLTGMGMPAAVSGVVDIYPKPIEEPFVTLRVSRAAELLGMDITPEIAADCLTRLGFTVETSPARGDAESPLSPPAGERGRGIGGDTLHVRVPTFRPDITLEEDLVEEVGRVYGYENIPERLPSGETTQGGDSAEGEFLMRVRSLLSASGLQEVVTHSLTAPFAFDPPQDSARRVAVRNALSAEISGLRRSLLPGLLDVAQRNGRLGTQTMALFEVGHVWQNEEGSDGMEPVEYLAVAGLLVGPLIPSGWQKDTTNPSADFGTARGILERLCEGLGIARVETQPLGDRAASLPQFHPGRAATVHLGGVEPAGVIGEIHPRVAATLQLRERIYVFELSIEALRAAIPAEGPRFQPLSNFPTVWRDLAPRVEEAVPYAEIEAAVRAAEAPNLESFRLTDVFRGSPVPEGMKSLTLRFTFRSQERTLSEADVNDALARIRAELETRCSATFVA